MAENKQYIIHDQETGVVMISEEVISAIVAHAIMEVEGVVGLAAKLGADRKLWNKGMKIVIEQSNELTIDCSITVLYGYAVVQVAQNAQEAISSAIESMTGVKPAKVNVNVCGIVRK